MENVERIVVPPEVCRTLVPEVNDLERDARVYRYHDHKNNWIMSIATFGEEGSGQLSLGGLRIAPEDRISTPDYNNDAEALNLAVGMEHKIEWTRLARVAGPLGFEQLDHIVGGKCVLHPTVGARIGESEDFELLKFGGNCLRDFHATTDIRPVTGQDLGHGTMSDGQTSSLDFIHKRYIGSIISDTSGPSAMGNFHVLQGTLAACGLDISEAHIGLVGCGHIGSHLLESLLPLKPKISVLEPRAGKKAELNELGIEVWHPQQSEEFFALPLDIVAFNANGGSLTSETARKLARNDHVKVICGCENLVMPLQSDELVLLEAKKIFCPTEYCGMMGYLTAVEEYLSHVAGKNFEIDDMLTASEKIEPSAQLAAELVLAKDFTVRFGDAVRTVCSGNGVFR